MSIDVDLPTIHEQLDDSPLQKTDASLSDYTSFDATLAKIEDPPTVEVKRSHVIDSINNARQESILIALPDNSENGYLFHITESDSTAYEGRQKEVIGTLVDLLLCEHWYIVKESLDSSPDVMENYFEEMTAFKTPVLDEGELFQRTYAIDQLKRRIYSFKQNASGL